MAEEKKMKSSLAIAAFLLVLGLILVYANHFNNPFHFDDDHTIVTNTSIRSFSNIPQFFKSAKTSSSFPANQSYRPVVTTLNTIDYHVAVRNPFSIKETRYAEDKGLVPFYFHLNIFMVLLFQGWLMFLLFKKILELTAPGKWNGFIALFMAALYCYHTAIAETVNYIIARSDGFSTVMGLLSLVIFAYFPKQRKYLFYVVPLLLAFFTKEAALMYVPIIFFYHLLIEQQISLTEIFSKANRKKAWSSVKIAVIPVVAAIFYFIMQHNFKSDTNVYATSSRFHYMITQPYVILHYFGSFFLPVQLSADTDWTLLNSLADIRFIVGTLFLIGLLLGIFYFSKKKQLLPVSFGLLWFLLALLPTSSVIPLAEVLNDHRMFFPFVGLTLAVVWFVIDFFKTKFSKNIKSPVIRILAFVAAIVIIVIHGYGTHQRNKVWSTEENLWYDVTVKSPENGRGLMNYGLTQMSKGNYPVAEKYFLKALKYTPNYSLLYVNLGVLYGAMNNPNLAEDYYKKAIALNTYTYQCNFYYGKFLKDQQRFTEAVFYLKKSVDENPQFLEGRHALMEAYLMTQQWELLQNLANETLTLLPGDALSQNYIKLSENKKSSVDMALELVKQQPTAENYLELSLRYYEQNKFDLCINACNDALKLKPDYALAYNNMCAAYNQLGNYKKAVEAGKKAVQLQPDFELAKNNLNYALSKLSGK